MDSTRRESLVAGIRSLLPKPDAHAQSRTVSLDARCEALQAATVLHREAGFIWLDGHQSRHFLFREPLAAIVCDGATATVRTANGSATFEARSLDFLDALLHAWSGQKGAVLCGFFAYDIAAELEDLAPMPAVSFGFPRMHLGLYDSVLTYDSGGWRLSGTDAWRGEDGLPRPVSAEAGVLRLAMETTPTAAHLPLPMTTPEFAEADAAFLNSVDRIVQRIHAGDFFQTNLCRRLQLPFASQHAWDLYCRMRECNPAEYGAFLQIGDGRSVLSTSPEQFLKVEDGIVETRPIKGTRRRGNTEEEDQRLVRDLLENPKDGAELAMIVDVSRNDLSRVCVPGSVKVSDHRRLLTLPTLHHTFSRIAGRVQEGATIADLLRASFPPASITGAPKISAMRAAFEEEGHARGPCMGSIGWISMDGQAELSVAIRTAYIDEETVYYLAGCGITAESISADELDESRIKAAGFLRAAGL